MWRRVVADSRLQMVLVRRFGVFAGTVALILATGGCAGAVTTEAGQRLPLTSPEFRTYVERVFREQNQVATQLAFAIEDDNAAAPTTDLMTAEDTLLTACAELNQLATARRDAQDLGVRKQAHAARQAPLCEAAIGSARAALERAAAAGGR